MASTLKASALATIMASQQGQPNSSRTADIEAWTQEAVTAMEAIRISSVTTADAVRGTTTSLDIPLDAEHPPRADQHGLPRPSAPAIDAPVKVHRREPVRRDSMKRREALLKGKEGSRRRQRWENNRLLGNPWAEPPEPRDFEIRPTYPVQYVPYYLAPLWDASRAKAQLQATEQARKISQKNREAVGRVPKDLRQRLKRSKAARGMLQDLEEQVRAFVVTWENRGKDLSSQGLADADSSEDEEIVFVGRNGQSTREAGQAQESLEKDKLIFESVLDDHGAAFGRWLVHSIAAYYNLRTWSRTVPGNPARREAYIGIKDRGFPSAATTTELPRPLWVLV